MPHSELASPTSAGDRVPRAEDLLLKAQHASRTTAARLRHQVVVDHLSLAMSIAHRYDQRGLERQDLEQVALLGLVQAVRRYRPGQGSGFLAFAVPTITGELKRHFRDHGWAVRPPRHLQEQSLAVRSCTERLAQELGRDPTRQEIADELGLSVGDVTRAEGADGQYVARSMDAPVDRDSGVSLGDTLGEVCRDLDRVEDFETLRPLLRTLKARERLIVRLRFVDNLTQRQIGQRIGVSQMQVSRLLTDILLRLRRAMDVDQDIGAAS
ncbi:MAG TPA: SigB/SigF/SigG family RNA polymerase sigma factor [Flexivirga sp.]|uniref:SigB/SigF/SigG family RNA polymerase sigma factor n=1 Tax=Flexivirga sp. TaxID=1962927 RepID=UPI002C6BF2C4|nr:SigB/SigF/SigG family RNA polymerase sigma factor [Flexivirga sp.]HWC21755.1 SigB/SigF/SigG family RNA polymerase sigma factor [Flexivirga sp.]